MRIWLLKNAFGCFVFKKLYWLFETLDSRLPTPDSRLPTPDSRLPTPDSRLPTPDSRLPTPDSRLFLRLFQHSHPLQYLLLIVPEKPELSKEKGNNKYDDLVAKKENTKPEKEFPGPKSIIGKTNPGGNAPGNIGCKGSGNCKSAQNQYHLLIIYLPFLF